jgi:hypothetical protein
MVGDTISATNRQNPNAIWHDFNNGDITTTFLTTGSFEENIPELFDTPAMERLRDALGNLSAV